MIELRYPATPDEKGVVDGLQLAAALIGHAVRLINPYVHMCPACLDDVFSALANTELEEMHRMVKEGKSTSETTCIYALGPDEKRDEAIRLHLAAAQSQIAALLGVEGRMHSH